MRIPLFSLALLAAALAAQTPPTRSVAITIDDLPRGGDTRRELSGAELIAFTREFLAPLKAARVPFAGFVNEGRRPAGAGFGDSTIRRWESLWFDAKAEMGNHTFSHPDLNHIPLERFEDEIRRGERILRPLAESRKKKVRYFRHPFLHVGLDLAKRRGAEAVIAKLGYQIAPVTIDNSDYVYALRYQQALEKNDPALARKIADDYLRYMDEVTAFFEQRAVETLGREPAQILLIHANRLNADHMPQLLGVYRRRGYKIVSLEEALRDPAYRLPDEFAGEQGISWLHHWSRTKGLPDKWEPDPPKWILDDPR